MSLCVRAAVGRQPLCWYALRSAAGGVFVLCPCRGGGCRCLPRCLVRIAACVHACACDLVVLCVNILPYAVCCCRGRSDGGKAGSDGEEGELVV